MTGNKLIPELHLWQSRFTYSSCVKFLKHGERIRKFKQVIYKNELHKACFAHDAAFADRKDLAKKIVSDKVLKDRVYEIVLNPKYDWYNRWIACDIHVFDKTESEARMTRKTGVNVNEVLPPELLKISD